ncbi:MAG: FecR domain-containing protein [Oscillospiraceae bacterium]|nr:FecR domain-containing protein [Oscillospiraceae bacterium]
MKTTFTRSSKPFISLLLIFAIIFSLSLAGLSAIAAGSSVSAEVASIKGKVTVKRASSERTVTAFAGMKLSQGDVVTTAAGAETVVNVGTDLSIKALSDSSFKIAALSTSSTGFTLIKGTVFNQVSGSGSGSNVSVQTGNTVVGVRGTTFLVSLRASEDDGSTIVRTLEGTVFLENVRKRLEADENASLVSDQTEVGAGNVSGSDGVYEFNLDDLLPDELKYILEHPDEFDAELLEEAQKAFDALPVEEEPDDAEEDTEIRYRPERPGPVTTYYTVTFLLDDDNGHLDYYAYPCPRSPYRVNDTTLRVPAGTLLTEDMVPMAVKLGASIYDWIAIDEDAVYFTYIPGNDYPIGDTPVMRNIVLMPLFEETSLPPSEFGDGSNTYPYIVTKNNFAHFRFYVHTYDTGGYNGLSKYYRLVDDIDFNDYPTDVRDWKPIGDLDNPFKGTFIGYDEYLDKAATRKIENFVYNISQSTDDEVYAGFFGYIDGTSISNYSIQSIDLYGEISVASVGGAEFDSYIGGIAGAITNGRITKCAATVRINATTDGDISMGGIMGGLNVIGAYGSQISECYSSGELVAASTLNKVSGLQGLSSNSAIYLGGIAGYVAQETTSPELMQNCYSNANVSATATGTNGSAHAGGIVGFVNGDDAHVSYCYYYGEEIKVARTSNTNTHYHYAGGIAGYVTSPNTINNCVMYHNTKIEWVFRPDAGKIWGSGALTGQSNYSNIAIQIDSNPAPTAPGGDNTNKEGGFVDYDNFLSTLSWWKAPAMWDIDDSSAIGSSSVWVFFNNRPVLRWQLS